MSRTTKARMIALVAVFFVVVAMLVGIRQASERIAATYFQPQEEVQRAGAVSPRVDTQESFTLLASPAKPAVPPVPQKPEAGKPKVSETPSTRTSGAEPEKKASMEPAALPAVPVTTPVASTVTTREGETAGTTGVDDAAPVTITGCLAVNESEHTFRLTGTSGADVPMSRSWKSGFLRKRAAPIELVDAADALRLESYVGRRIAATGRLTNRELQVHSLRQAGQSCN